MDNQRYILPVTINGRRIHYLDVSQDVLERDVRIEPFVATLQRGRTLLFSVDRKQKARTLTRGACDIDLAACSFAAAIANGRLVVTISEEVVTKPVTQPAATDDDDEGDYILQQPKTSRRTEPRAAAIATDGTLSAAIPGLSFECEYTDRSFAVYASLHRLPDQEVKHPVHLECWLQFPVVNSSISGGRFLMQLAHPLQVAEAGLDFGSEASQIIQRTTVKAGQAYHPSVKTPDLFERIKNYLERTGTTAADTTHTATGYLQQETGTPFYKSVFFLKKQLNFDSEVHEYADCLPGGDADNLKMITANTGEEVGRILKTHRQLPNLKLSRKYKEQLNVYDYNFRVSDGYDTVTSPPLDELLTPTLGSILETMIISWAASLLERALAPRYIMFTLLVPNIYDEKDVNISVSNLHGIMSRLQDKYGSEKFGGWEVQTISESDASFLGFQRIGGIQVMPDKYYLVVDCGKGTTDFSIISCTGHAGQEKLTPIYRDGFAGAGNLITYAFFETVIAYLMDNADNPAEMGRFINNYLATAIRDVPGGDPYYLNEIASILETFKKNYDPSKDMRAVYDDWERTEDNRVTGGVAYHLENSGYVLGKLRDLLKKQQTIADWNGYIADACKEIADAVSMRVVPIAKALRAQKLEPGGVLLTGRGFLFKPLANELVRQLETALTTDPSKPMKIEQPATAAAYKDVCMKGLLNPPFVLDTEKIGWPVPVPKRDEEPAAVAQPRNSIFSRIARYISSGTVTSTNALEGKLPSFRDHYLLINNQYWSPKKLNEWGSNVVNCDLLFLPEGKFCVRWLDDRDYLLDESDIFSEERDPFAQEHLVPSLFPVVIDKGELEKRIQQITKA